MYNFERSMINGKMPFSTYWVTKCGDYYSAGCKNPGFLARSTWRKVCWSFLQSLEDDEVDGKLCFVSYCDVRYDRNYMSIFCCAFGYSHFNDQYVITMMIPRLEFLSYPYVLNVQIIHTRCSRFRALDCGFCWLFYEKSRKGVATIRFHIR